MRRALIQWALSGLLLAFTSSYGDSVGGMWHSKENVGKALALREDGSFSLEESGPPAEGSQFNIEFSLAPGNSYLGYGFGPLPDSTISGSVVTRYKVSAPLRDWQFVIRGHWTQEGSTLQLNIGEFEVSRVNGASVPAYVEQLVRAVLTDATLSEAESDELSHLLSQITPMRGGLADLGAELSLPFSVSGDELRITGDEGQFSGGWIREVSQPSAVEAMSWGAVKRGVQASGDDEHQE
jgi:hypothetical protein